MKIIFFTKEDWEEEYIKNAFPADEVACYKNSLQEALASGLYKGDLDAEVLCVFVTSRVGEEELALFPNLRLVATRSTGFDHVDVPAAQARGIAVATVPAYGAVTVAEFAFALILSLSRRICEAHTRTAQEHALSQGGLRGFDLFEKTLGIVGCGHIGAHVARIAAGFGMRVVVCDEHEDHALAEKLGFRYAPLLEVLGVSDVVTLHAPYSPQTHHLINKKNIAAFKAGAYLINTARGALVETEALIEALESGALAGAGLDVLEDEHQLTKEETALAQHARVIVTPHIAFDTTEAVVRIMETTVANIKTFLAGEPENIVH